MMGGFSLDEISQAISDLRNEYQKEFAEEAEGSPVDPADDPELDADEINPANSGVNLAKIRLSDWDAIPVSPKSRLGDPLWDFTDYPMPDVQSPKIGKLNFDYWNSWDFNLAQEPIHRLRLVKGLLLYRIPHYSFTGLNLSYGSLAGFRSVVLDLVSLFRELGLYESGSEAISNRSLDDVSRDTVVSKIEALSSPHKVMRCASLVRNWQELSRSGMLPACYALKTEFFSKEDIDQYYRAQVESTNAFQPIPLDDFAQIVSYCKTLVDEYSTDILWLARTYCTTLVGHSPDRASVLGAGFSTASPEGVAAFRAYTPKLVNGRPWWNICVCSRSHPQDSGEYINYGVVSRYVHALRDACCTLVFATTGMRRSEMGALKVGCATTDQAGHWLTFMVYKTSSASQGEVKKIPIPEVTFRAIRLLEELGAESRRFGEHDYLITGLTRAQFGRRSNIGFTERAVARVAEASGVDEGIHPHRFRKSLAMYLVHQDPKNIELIRHLFSHKSLRMTLKYILALPSVNDELKRALISQNAEILEEILRAASSNKIGGRGGKRIQTQLEDSRVFSARLHDDGKETIQQYVESLLEQGIKLLHRTNLAICIRTPSTNDAPPCVGRKQGAASKLHPNLFACDPFGCDFAVFTEESSQALESEIAFHDGLIAHPYCGSEQRNYSERRVRDAKLQLAEVKGEGQQGAAQAKYG